MANRKRPQFRFDRPGDSPRAQSSTSAPAAIPRESDEDRKSREFKESLARYQEKMGPEHARLNRQLAAQGKPPLKVAEELPEAPAGREFPRSGIQDRTSATKERLPPLAPTTVEMREAKVERAPPAPRGTEYPTSDRPEPFFLAEDDPADRLNPHLPRVTFDKVEHLPSRGVTYPAGAHVSYRTYMLGELEEFENPNLSPRDKHLLILRGLQTNFDKFKLTLQDVMYLGLLRRISTYGSQTLGVTTVCDRCGGTNHSKVATSAVVGGPQAVVAFNELDIPSAPVTLRLSFGDHQFWPMTVGDYIGMLDQGVPINGASILAVQCHTLDFPESVEILRTVNDPKDQRLLKRLADMFEHGIAPIEVNCQNETFTSEDEIVPCGHVYRRSLVTMAEAFIYPFRPEGDDLEDQIEFG